MRPPSRRDVSRALREISILWRPPPEKETADSERNPTSAAQQSNEHLNSTPARATRAPA
jgi:hypothetical protein